MDESSRNVLSVLISWLVVAVPVGLGLLIATWISINWFGVSPGVAYTAALAIWGVFLFWRWRRSQR